MLRSIVWFRNDLRVHDNEALYEAHNSSDQVLPIYIFDERIFLGKTSFGFKKTGKLRCQFIIESVENLKRNLLELGSDLMIAIGKPEEIIPSLARKHKTSWIFCNRERTEEEVTVQDALERNLWEIGQELRYSRGKMLYYTADLPFPISHTPDVFSNFRKEVEKFVKIRIPIHLTKKDCKPVPDEIDITELPSLADFGHSTDITISPDYLKGGESSALKSMNYYLWESKNVKNYKNTRNELLGRDYSTKLSAYLSQGCLSPKLVYQELKLFESEFGANTSTYWVFFELMWRDFFRLMGKKHGNKIFQKGGIKSSTVEKQIDMDLFEQWRQGKTGVPFIDANMIELKKTGFMSNRGRQNVASYLIHNMNLLWLIGAEYFESVLIDYDPCSNYGNWNYIAGIGNDPKEKRVFNVILQSKKYDSKGEFIKNWIPELIKIQSNSLHEPWKSNENKNVDFYYKKPIHL